MAKSGRFRFDGGAATYWGTAVLAFLITVFTFGVCYPFALVLRERWKAKHTYIDGRQLVFDGSAWALFGNWLKWGLLTIVTLGIYSFWVRPRLTQWVVENTDFAPTFEANPTAPALPQAAPVGSGPVTPALPAVAQPVVAAVPVVAEPVTAQRLSTQANDLQTEMRQTVAAAGTLNGAGWYPNPDNAAQWKYFDGQNWTEHTAPM